MFKRTLPVLLALLLAAQVLAGQPALADARANPHPTPTPTVPMGVSHIVGFEMGPGGAGANMAAPEAFSLTNPSVISVQSATVRSGTYALRMNTTGGALGTNTFATFAQRAAGGVSRTGYQSMRAYLRVGTLPNIESEIWRVWDGTNLRHTLFLETSGAFRLKVAGGTTGTASSTTISADGNWHLLELDVGYNAGADGRLFLDGVQIATATSGLAAINSTQASLTIAASATADLYWDDIVFDDGALNGALGSDYSVGVLLPVSDNTVSPAASWTGGAGGTTNLWDAVNNIPPGGLASLWTNISEVKSASGTNPAFYVANMAAYSTLQPNAATIGTILGVQAVANHAEEIATGTKSGDVWISGNPAQSQPISTGFGSFNFGDDIGVITAFTAATSDWRTAVGPVTASPSVTLTTQPTVRLDKIDATTRVAHADFLGLYVMYTLVQPPELTGTPYGLRGQAQMRQLLAQ